MLKRIVVGTDGSETAAIAVRQAVDLAGAAGAALELVTAYPKSIPGPAAAYDPTVAEGEETRDLPPDVPRAVGARAEPVAVLDHAAAEAAQAGIEAVRTHAREGDPARAIIAVAEETGADLIVVGNKGMTGSARFLLGSVPDKISHHAPCSVLIVRTT